MDENIRAVQKTYDEGVEGEWERLERHLFEFEITVRMMDRYIKRGDRILDIGGGPGRYSIHYAKKGCDVTLFDLSSENVKFALSKADECGVKINAYSGDARFADTIVSGEFDHVFLMGPMYHLLEEEDRIKAVNSALKLLKKGGNLYVSFIMMFAGMIYGMKLCPELVIQENEQKFIKCVLDDTSYSGDAFTKVHFASSHEIAPLMKKFPLEKIHLFGQESILAPCEQNILNQPEEIREKWIDIAYNLCEREELLSYSEHVMYIGRKI